MERYDELIKTILESDYKNKDQLVSALFLTHDSGIRFGELFDIRKEDFDIQNQTVVIRSRKTRTHRQATIIESEIFWFKNIVNRLKDNDKIITLSPATLSNRLLPFFKSFNIPNFHFLRKDCVNRLIAIGATEYQVYIKMGWKYQKENKNEIDWNGVKRSLISLETIL